MANTTSLSFPNMFNVAQNRVGVLEDNVSISNRNRLLILTEPTELYNSPDFGVGLSRYLFTYKNANSVAAIQDRIKTQVDKYEPHVNAENTVFSDGLLYTDSDSDSDIKVNFNELKMTMTLETIYHDTTSVNVSG